MKRDTRDNPGDDDARLDELLATARWPEPSEASTERLRRQWLSLRSTRAVFWSVAAAAAVLIAIGSAMWFNVRPKRVEAPRVAILPAPAPIESAPTASAPSIPSRPATLRERLVLLSASPPPSKPTPPTQPKPEIDPAARLQLAIDAAAHERLVDAVVLLKPLPRRDVERRLAEIAAATEGETDERVGATRLLGEVAGEGSFPLLIRLAAEPDLVASAMPGISRLGGAAALSKLARTSSSQITRRESFRALLSRGDAAGTDEFLALVLDPNTRGGALAALHDAPEPAVRSLLAALDHRRVDYRLAAAKSLGSVCDHGDVGARLQQMVRDNDNRREALAALVSCPGKPAADFLREARDRPSIDVEVRAVQSELAGIFVESNPLHRRS